MIDFLFKNIENHPVLVTVVIFALGIIGFFIRRWFFKENSNASIKAGGNIIAGGDIVTGNKSVVSYREEQEEKNIRNFERFVENEEWKKEFIDNKEVWICQKDNTYQIEIGQEGRDFKEEWTQVYPDKQHTTLYPVYLKIGGVQIKQISFIFLDGGRIFVPLPKIITENDSRFFIWNRESLEYKIGKIIGYYYIYDSLEGVAKMSKIKII